MQEKKDLLKCWQHFNCDKVECPAYRSDDLRCWLQCGTHCHGEIQGTWLEKMEACLKCEVFERNFQDKDSKETLSLISSQFEDYEQKVLGETRRLEEIQKKLVDFKLTSIYILREFDKKSTELSSAKSYINNIINSMADSLIVIDTDGRIKMLNQATLELLGYEGEELIGRPVDIVLKEKRGILFFKNTIVRTLRKQGKVKNYNITYVTKGGEKIPMNLSGSLLRNGNNNTIGAVYIARDMREMNQLIRALEEARSDLERKVEERTREIRDMQTQLIRSAKMATIGQFAAGIAHEINNPLAGILNFVRSLLGDPEIKGQRRGYLELVLKGLLRIENTIGQILSFAGRQKIEPRLVDPNRLIGEALTFMEHRMSEQEISLGQNLTDPPPPILADPHQLQQVFMNIISNALDALHRGGTLNISSTIREGALEIKFTDNGKGIKEEDLDRVFDPFYTTKEVGRGVGLGLSISYTIIEQHRGRINIESKEDKGTTVTLTLPVAEESG